MIQPGGIILAGGRSTRMGGGDKGLRPLAGQPMLAHVVARLAPQVAALALNANGDPQRWASFGLPVLPDSCPGQPGPLAGILAGMDWAAEAGLTHVVSVATDAPFLPCDLVPRLLLAAEDGGAAFAVSPAGPQPVFGLWPVTQRDTLRAALTDGMRRVRDWIALCAAAPAPFPADAAFFNINTPEDLAQAGAMA